jgi:hypothetical protein
MSVHRSPISITIRHPAKPRLSSFAQALALFGLIISVVQAKKHPGKPNE